jgi:hypothetical protein
LVGKVSGIFNGDTVLVEPRSTREMETELMAALNEVMEGTIAA